jgi:hypothetical protein
VSVAFPERRWRQWHHRLVAGLRVALTPRLPDSTVDLVLWGDVSPAALARPAVRVTTAGYAVYLPVTRWSDSKWVADGVIVLLDRARHMVGRVGK